MHGIFASLTHTWHNFLSLLLKIQSGSERGRPDLFWLVIELYIKKIQWYSAVIIDYGHSLWDIDYAHRSGLNSNFAIYSVNRTRWPSYPENSVAAGLKKMCVVRLVCQKRDRSSLLSSRLGSSNFINVELNWITVRKNARQSENNAVNYNFIVINRIYSYEYNLVNREH